MALAPLAAAQATNNSTDPTVNESDFDTSTPPADDAYLNDSSAPADPTVSDSDFDMTVPSNDAAWLDAEAASADASPASGGSAAKPAPGLALPALLVGLAGVALLARRR